jgi:hypothetical protein
MVSVASTALERHMDMGRAARSQLPELSCSLHAKRHASTEPASLEESDPFSSCEWHDRFALKTIIGGQQLGLAKPLRSDLGR